MLLVGVDENTPAFGVRNDDGQLEGLEIDLVREIARPIWPEDAADIDQHIKFVSVVTEQKVPYVRWRQVDLTASVVTINCDRWKDVAFSTSYFTTPQRVLVRVSDIDGSTTSRDARSARPAVLDDRVCSRSSERSRSPWRRAPTVSWHSRRVGGGDRDPRHHPPRTEAPGPADHPGRQRRSRSHVVRLRHRDAEGRCRFCAIRERRPRGAPTGRRASGALRGVARRDRLRPGARRPEAAYRSEP